MHDIKLGRWAAVGLLLVLFAVLTLGVPHLSFTADEPTYIACGYAFLKTGTASFPLLAQRYYPPLLISLEASLLYLGDPTIPVKRLDGWGVNYDAFTQAFLPYMAPLERTQFIARIPTLWLAVILGALVWRWSKTLWGNTAGWLALTLLVFDPTLLAHGRLATSDVGVTAIGTAALYAAWRWRRQTTWRQTFIVGGLLGLTLLAKTSGTLWAASAVLMMLSAFPESKTRGEQNESIQNPKSVITSLLHILTAGILSLLILWAGYGFTIGTVAALPFPLPAPTYWQNTTSLAGYNTIAYFALDQWQYERWWWYFPLAFALKNPLPLLGGFFLGLVVLLRRRESRRILLLLGIFPVLYAAAAITQGLNIGYRHMIPIHPFLYLIIAGGLGQIWRAWHTPSLLKKAIPVVVGAWYILGTLRTWPYELTYFNELAGGPQNAYHYLADSNLEWGQTQKALAAYVQEHPNIHSDAPPAKFHPTAGRYIVNASYLQGIGLADPDRYGWFRYWEPTATFKRSLLIYDVPDFTPEWIAQCGAPDVPLDNDAIKVGMGRADLRNVSFDCTRAWLYPGGAAQPGLYALDDGLLAESRLRFPSLLPDDPRPQDPFIQRRLANVRLSFKQTYPQPTFVLYEMTDAAPSPAIAAPIYAAPVEVIPAALRDASPLVAPIALDGPLTFLGVSFDEAAGSWEVETWWQVTSGPITRPLSMMAHLITADGAVLGTDDGLNVWPLTLRAGDVFVQRHRFEPAAEQAEVWLRTGVYWLDDGTRWHINTELGAADAFFISPGSTRPSY